MELLHQKDGGVMMALHGISFDFLFILKNKNFMKKLLLFTLLIFSLVGYSQSPTRGALLTLDTAANKPGIKMLAVNALDNTVVFWDLVSWSAVGVGGGAADIDATVDFSVNANPNTAGTTFSPNTPGLSTRIYVSTIDGSQWTYNGTYVLYIAPYWAKTGNAGTNSTHFIGPTDSVPFNIRVKNIKSGSIDPGSTITSFGYSALANNSGIGNTAFGYKALSTNTTGTLNTAFGTEALALNNGAGTQGNTAFGYQALALNTTATLNTAVGERALSVSTGTANTAIGARALRFNTTGTNNTGVGREALNANTIGRENTGIGFGALKFMIDGQRNTAVGYNAMLSGNTGTDNTAIGNGALSNTTGNANVGIGLQAGWNNTTGGQQIFLNSILRANYAADQDESPVYIQQDATVTNQDIYLNGNVLINVGQVGMGIKTTPDASAKLEIVSTTQGLLPPRMTSAQADAIASKAIGLTVYCTDCTAIDASTGVMQTWNAAGVWKKYW